LREVETKLSTAAPAARRELAAQQVAIMDQVLAAAADADRPFWVRQIAETLAAYVQGDLVPDGIGRLDKLAADVAADPTLSAFVTFRLIQSRYALGAQQSGADGEKAEKARAAWLAELAAFVDKHPASPDAAEAMLQLAIEDEFSGREKESLAFKVLLKRDESRACIWCL
jgi:hypothetical protein